MRYVTVACFNANSFAYAVQEDCTLVAARLDQLAYLTTDPNFDAANYPLESGVVETVIVPPQTVQLTEVGRQLSKGEILYLIPENQPGNAVCMLYLSSADNP